ncbi:MAG TPA: hypothetical protein VNJ09_03170, partial [Chthonomonadales bacterium]|nr:hypothetical protein [Chthonomonadales bacterium]
MHRLKTLVPSVAVTLLWMTIPAFSQTRAPTLPVVVTGSTDQTYRIWDAFGKRTQEILAHDGPITCLILSRDGRRIVTGSMDKS